MKRILKTAAILFAAWAIATGCKPTTRGTLNGHEWIDLGLPSGTLWATCNVGANVPEEYGDYFAWGETEPKTEYSHGIDYWYSSRRGELTKYCNNPNKGYKNFTDNLNVLQPIDDAATDKWGDGWRTPTVDEMRELTDNCTREWIMDSSKNVYGVLFTGPNNKKIFLPAAGWLLYSSTICYSEHCSYWSSSLDQNDEENAYCLFCSGEHIQDGVTCDNRQFRWTGHSVRPVCSKAHKVE